MVGESWLVYPIKIGNHFSNPYILFGFLCINFLNQEPLAEGLSTMVCFYATINGNSKCLAAAHHALRKIAMVFSLQP